MHQKYMMVFSNNTNLVFIIILKIAGFFFYIQDNIPHFSCVAFKTVDLKMLITVQS